MDMTAGAESIRDYEKARWRQALRAALLATPLCLALLLIEYRAMILCVIPLLFVLLPLVEVRALRATLRGLSTIRVSGGDDDALTIVLSGGSDRAAEEVRLPLRQITAARVTPSTLLLVQGGAGVPFRRYVVPVSPPDGSAAAAWLQRRGVAVAVEPETGRALATLLASVIFVKALRGIAAVLLLGAMAQGGLFFLGHGGDLWQAAAFFGGAVTTLLVAAILAHLSEVPAP